MQGRLYTADEIFEAIKLATDKTAADHEFAGAYMITRIGADIAYETAVALGFDMKQLEEYCQERLEEEDGTD